MENKNLDAELDEIFIKVVEIQIAPKIQKKRPLNTGTNQKISLIIYLSEPSDQKDIYEVTDIKYIDNRSSCITVKGISETLEIGLVFEKTKLHDLKRRNKDIKFIEGVRTNGSD